MSQSLVRPDHSYDQLAAVLGRCEGCGLKNARFSAGGLAGWRAGASVAAAEMKAMALP